MALEGACSDGHESRGAVLSAPIGAETGYARALRRSLTIPAYVLLWLAAVGLAPVAVPLLWLSDRLGGGRTARARLGVFGIVFLSYELAGLSAAGLLWLARLTIPDAEGTRDQAAHRRLQNWWALGLFRAAGRILRLRLSVEGADAVTPGPLLVLIRHASLADTLLPTVVIAARGIRLRYVLKRELLWDPCLDVVGQRLPNAFIRRGGESEVEVAAIAALARDLESDEGVLIYPEGTRFTRAKLERALERIAASGRPELLERARAFGSILPPRIAGTLALLEANPTADVLIVAHTGLENLASAAEILQLGADERRIRVRVERVPRESIPIGRAARVEWLFDEWARVDAFVAVATT